MKTIVEVRDSIVRGVLMERNMGDAQIDQILREYAESIVQLCVDNAEYTMEECSEDESVIYNKEGKTIHPVLMRSSIEAVKNLIK